MKTDQGTVVARFPKRVALAVIIVGLGAFLSQWAGDWQGEYVPAEIVLIALAAFLPLLTSFMLKRLSAAKSAVVEMSASPESASAWWDQALDSAFGGLRPYALGAVLVTAGIPTIKWAWIPWSGGALFVFYLFSALLLFLTGVAGWAFLRLLTVLHQLSGIGVKALPFAWPQAEISALHGVLMQVFAGGLLAYLLAVIGIWLSPGGTWFLANGPVGWWVIPLAATVVFFFCAVEYYIHVLLEKAKQERLRQLSEILQEKFSEWRQSGTKDAAEAVSTVLKWHDAVRAERSWPLDVLSMTSVVVGVLIPAAKALKELITA